MIITGVVLLILGALVAYVGRPREQLLFYAGVIIFLIGAGLVIVWAVSSADQADTSVALFGPLAWVLRRIASKLDGQHEAIIPPGGYVFWSYSPTMPRGQWAQKSPNNNPLGDSSKIDLN